MYSAKLKVNFVSGEFEIAGEKEFVTDQIDNPGKISNLVKELHKEFSSKEMIGTGNVNLETNLELDDTKNDIKSAETFGEWFQKFKKDLTDTDKALITAYYIQKNSSDNEFKTIEVTKTLKDYGIRLSNTSLFLNNLQSQGYIFPTEKKGNVMYRRVSKDGYENLKTLIKE